VRRLVTLVFSRTMAHSSRHRTAGGCPPCLSSRSTISIKWVSTVPYGRMSHAVGRFQARIAVTSRSSRPLRSAISIASRAPAAIPRRAGRDEGVHQPGQDVHPLVVGHRRRQLEAAAGLPVQVGGHVVREAFLGELARRQRVLDGLLGGGGVAPCA